MSKAAELAALIGSQSSLTNRNMIINGNMAVAQRGTSSTGVPTSAKYYPTVDRFAIEAANTAGRLTMTQEAITDLSGFNNAIKLDCTTADTSIAAAEYGVITYIIEAQDCQKMMKGHSDAKAVTLSFYVKGTAKTYMIEMQDADNNRHNTQQFSVTSDWTRVVLTFAGDTTGKINDDNGQGIILHLWFHGGSTYTGGTYTANTWAGVTTNNRAAGIGSFFSSTDNEFFITGVQLEVGEVATPFEHETFGNNLARCQRYFQNTLRTYTSGYQSGTTAVYTTFFNLVPMRANPTMTNSSSTISVSQAGGAHSNRTTTGLTATLYGNSGAGIEVIYTCGGGIGGSDNNPCQIFTLGTLSFDAEL